jgi:hypothetical protein
VGGGVRCLSRGGGGGGGGGRPGDVPVALGEAAVDAAVSQANAAVLSPLPLPWTPIFATAEVEGSIPCFRTILTGHIHPMWLQVLGKDLDPILAMLHPSQVKLLLGDSRQLEGSDRGLVTSTSS